MAGFKKITVAAACLFSTVAAQHDPKGYVYQEHVLQHPYSDDGMTIPHWDYQGSTVITDKEIRLTPDRQSKRGLIWNTSPWNPPREDDKAYFEITMEFKVHGQGTKLYGDGFALWYTEKIQQTGPVFGSEDGFKGIGIFFDTYSNVQQGHSQYISVMFGDGTQAYDHDKDGGDGKLAGCSVDFRGHKMDVRIVYNDDLLRMYTGKPDEGWEECFIVRRVSLKRGYHFGLSAATGDLADNHDINFFKVTDPVAMTDAEREDLSQRIEMDVDKGVENQVHHDPQYENYEPPVGRDIPLWMSIVGIFGAVAVIGGVIYYSQRKKEHHAKHFT